VQVLILRPSAGQAPVDGAEAGFYPERWLRHRIHKALALLMISLDIFTLAVNSQLLM